MKTFRAVDGRRCIAKVTEEKAIAARRLDIAAVIAPLAMILMFARAAGMI